jgi:hypothetical protein
MGGDKVEEVEEFCSDSACEAVFVNFAAGMEVGDEPRRKHDLLGLSHRIRRRSWSRLTMVRPSIRSKGKEIFTEILEASIV